MRTFHNAKDNSGPYLALCALFGDPLDTKGAIAYSEDQRRLTGRGYIYKNHDTAVTIKRRTRRLEK